MTRTADLEDWSRVSTGWIAWARPLNRDAVWAYRESLVIFIGRSEGEALDVGCGEGRVSCQLKTCGFRLTASDPVRELVNTAKEARPAEGPRRCVRHRSAVRGHELRSRHGGAGMIEQ
jgi:2-polyprenyl-3-methyl-5-hydroxy-6-metoxy-1,4-benzoquinol methylase